VPDQQEQHVGFIGGFFGGTGALAGERDRWRQPVIGGDFRPPPVEEPDDLQGRAFSDIVHVGFIRQPEYGDLPPGELSGNPLDVLDEVFGLGIVDLPRRPD
jgi:hypothetical protein